MANLRWSLTAGNDLRDIEDFIARDSVLHAVTFVDLIIETAERVLSTPQLGRIVPEFNRKNLREIIFRGYRVIYLLWNEEIIVLRVVHGARALRNLTHREPWDIST